MQLARLLSVLAGFASLATAAATPTCKYAKATPTPAGYTCEVQGSVQRPAVLYNLNPVRTLQACWSACVNTQRCLSYSYNPSSKTCTFYTKTLANQVFTKGNTGVTFAARNCYTCGCAAGLTKCGQNCLNLQTDNNNCGKCGNVCGGSSTCSKGTCVCSKPGYLWRSSADSIYAGAYIGYLGLGSTLQPTYDLTKANVFNFEGTNVTTPVGDITALAVILAQLDPSKNPPNHNNTDGTGVYTGQFSLIDEKDFDDNAVEALSCVATPQRQLSCQKFNTINKLQLCTFQDTNGRDVTILYIADKLVTGSDRQCGIISLDLVCVPNI